jgi:flagellar motor switch protein FliM
VLSLLKTHGSHHIAQIDDIKAKNFAHEAEVWKAMLNHINTIADALAKQFPNKIETEMRQGERKGLYELKGAFSRL